MRIAVVGLGKIGLPLAAQFADKGHEVIGVDINETTVETINEGIEPFPGEAYLQEYLTRLVPCGHLRATSDYSAAIPVADVVVVVVPLFVDNEGNPDFAWMDSATQDIAVNLTPGTLVSYETTLPVGTTRTRWKPTLEGGNGLAEGEDFHVVFSPERVLTGRVFEDLRKYPKLVGGLSKDGAQLAVDFYESVLDFAARPDLDRGNGVWDLGTAEAAELTKLAETTYRDVNIALANQFAKFSDSSGINVYQVIEAANSQPFSHIHRPGLAVGGHCIPVYPQLYLSNDPDAPVVRAARTTNTQMPAHAVDVLEHAMKNLNGIRVTILGAAYRGGVKETAFSGVFALVSELSQRGADVRVHDPMFTSSEIQQIGFKPYKVGDPTDAIVVQADHSEYSVTSPSDFPGVQVAYDGRRILNQKLWSNINSIVIGMGSGTP